MCINIYIYKCICIYTYIYKYIHIHAEREREREIEKYIYKERKIKRDYLSTCHQCSEDCVLVFLYQCSGSGAAADAVSPAYYPQLN